MIEFKILGNPKAKERIRMGLSNNGQIYRFTPKPTKEYEKEIKRIYTKNSFKFFEEDKPLYIKITTYGERPKKINLKNKYSVSKPDLDNCAKIILDALNNVAYKDDSQVAKLECEKFYTDKNPYVSVKIMELKENVGVPTKRSFEGEKEKPRSDDNFAKAK